MCNISPKSEPIRPKNSGAMPENLFERFSSDGRFPCEPRYSLDDWYCISNVEGGISWERLYVLLSLCIQVSTDLDEAIQAAWTGWALPVASPLRTLNYYYY